MRLAAVVLAAAWVAPAVASAEPPLYLPWACDEVHHVTNGHNTNTHTGKDAYAWDFGLAEGVDVHAPADGVVRLIKMDSSQGGCDVAYANDANYVVLEFGDGTEALMMHLAHASSDLHVGDAVAQGDVVGRVGLTGWVCGAHLHFQIQNSCDSWWCQSIPAEFVDVGDPKEDVDMPSNNCPVAEPCAATLDGSETVIDDSEARCFRRVSSWFWPGAGGLNDGHTYTWANANAEPDSIGRWEFGVAMPGPYRLEVHVPEAEASSQLAIYEVQTGAEMVAVGPVDQSTQKGWVDLGVHEIVAGEEHWVRLRDNTGEDRALDRALAFDAIRWTFEPAGSGDESSGGESEGESAGEEGEDPTSAGTTAAGEDDGGETSSGEGGVLPPGSQDDASGSGCSIGSRAAALPAVVMLLGLRRRRRSRSG